MQQISHFSGAAKSENNDNCCNSTPCPELVTNASSNESSSVEVNDSVKHEDRDVQSKGDSVPTTSQDPPRESIDFKVIYNKQRISVNFPLDGTVAELKTHLQNIISVPEAMQKVMIKGLAKDDQTLRSLEVTKGIPSDIIAANSR